MPSRLPSTQWSGWPGRRLWRGGFPAPRAYVVRCALVDAAAVEQALGAWVSGCLRERETQRRAPAPGQPELRAVALDGNAVRGAQTHGAKVHLVSLVTHASALTLAQCVVEAKSNEIPAAQRLLAGRDLRGWVVTLDALHTQRETAERIVRQGGHYLMVVKQNQPSLYATLDEWFTYPDDPAEQERAYTTTGKAHGRLERRTLCGRRLTPCGAVD